jgi:hypothetical protein
MRTGRGAGVLLAASVWLVTAPAHAFCGFYAGSATQSELTAEASRVVLLREGTRTVITMQNSYRGPLEEFAMVVPVPAVLSQRDVRALDPAVFDRLDQFTAPRIVEYEERPRTCPAPRMASRHARMPMIRAGAAGLVTIEAEFTTAEYDIVILSAADSTALETWLRDHRYHVPEGAADALRPYVAAGTKFFVARVDPRRVRFEDGRAMLSPLRFHYDAPELTLPVRLGVLNSRGVQDLVVYVLARDQRFEVANRPGLFAPTNVEVAPEALAQFGAVYEALFDRAMERYPDAVVTEHAWAATSCDPCPGPSLTVADLNALGGDVVSGAVVDQVGPPEVEVGLPSRVSGRGSTPEGLRDDLARRLANIEPCVAGLYAGQIDLTFEARLSADGRLSVPAARGERPGAVRCIARRLDGARILAPPLHVDDSEWLLSVTLRRAGVLRQTSVSGFSVTRLRTRIRKHGRIDDLVLRAAPAIDGGRGTPDGEGRLSRSVERARSNNFQSRFVVLHRDEREPACARPQHTGWQVPSRARGARRVPGRSLPIEELVRSPLPELGLSPERRPRRRAEVDPPAPRATPQPRLVALPARRRRG